MGWAKELLLESQERGWDAPDKHVCANCVDDEFLKDVIQSNVEAQACDYCGHQSVESIAAPVEAIMHPIGGAFFTNFAEPGAAMLPRDSGDWIQELTYTHDALESLPLHCHGDLFEDVARSFHNWGWVQCANGFWLSEHDSTIWRWSWENFERIVKTSTRYFFAGTVLEDFGNDEISSTDDLLRLIGSIAQELELYRTLEAETPLYRVRKLREGEVLNSFEQLGPPPSSKASAGRMNPAGIGYLYLAQEQRTAIGEVLSCPPCQGAIATFTPKDNLRILDLASLPEEEPSIFDTEKRDIREAILFLKKFVHAISKPIPKDSREHVDFVPSQVVSEFFAQVFLQEESDRRIDGIVYPSAIVPNGQNVVIFPPRESMRDWKDVVELRNVELIIAENWNDHSTLVSV